ncbi:hypothetical protein HELRODRAFT_193497 [Helobdella robusta]|uniref:Uncharacterized protein n=1 Tax=Helobdella robusta TaxID=6412 RepID=T1FV20_HELRO|nr:hypothetical protein HELRODRAFT_193497 [Helobdella robusta]ESN95867.1 hypothetical protein HELRODRAFT_193497 [Helobdella robusta]
MPILSYRLHINLKKAHDAVVVRSDGKAASATPPPQSSSHSSPPPESIGNQVKVVKIKHETLIDNTDRLGDTKYLTVGANDKKQQSQQITSSTKANKIEMVSNHSGKIKKNEEGLMKHEEMSNGSHRNVLNAELIEDHTTSKLQGLPTFGGMAPPAPSSSVLEEPQILLSSNVRSDVSSSTIVKEDSESSSSPLSPNQTMLVTMATLERASKRLSETRVNQQQQRQDVLHYEVVISSEKMEPHKGVEVVVFNDDEEDCSDIDGGNNDVGDVGVGDVGGADGIKRNENDDDAQDQVFKSFLNINMSNLNQTIDENYYRRHARQQSGQLYLVKMAEVDDADVYGTEDDGKNRGRSDYYVSSSRTSCANNDGDGLTKFAVRDFDEETY